MMTSTPINPVIDALAKFSQMRPDLWIKLGNLETKALSKHLPPVTQPVYICGLARSGSTLLLEILATHPNAATHRYGDFPFVMTPYLWHIATFFERLRTHTPKERAHGDGMMVTSQSPEAMEEILWARFFSADTHGSNHERLSHAFNAFYREHIQKLLMIRGAKRYVCKNNYNIQRMDYLTQQFADARFIIPVREPKSHIASLMRQHKRFMQLASEDPRVAEHMNYACHFEFGPHRMPIHLGDDARHNAIIDAWKKGDEVRGWALYWDSVYRFLHAQQSRYKTCIVKHETLQATPVETIDTIFAHAGLPIDISYSRQLATMVKSDSDASGLPEKDQQIILEITGSTAALYGYGG